MRSGRDPEPHQDALNHETCIYDAEDAEGDSSGGGQAEAFAETEEDVVYPSATLELVADLAIWRDGLKRIADTPDGRPCSYIVRGLQNIQAHCRDEHGWENVRKRGRAPRGRQPEARKTWVESVRCQNFGKAGKLGNLFELGARRERRRGEEEEGADLIERQVEAAFRKATVEMEMADKEADSVVQEDGNTYITNAWLKRAGWAKHLAGFDQEWLAGLVRKPEKWGKALRRVCSVVEMVI